MKVHGSTFHPPATPAEAPKRPRDAAEAARQFEEVLARQFVREMTQGLFGEGLAGEEAPGWMGAYGDMQRDALTDVLTKHLIDQGTLRLSDRLMQQWTRRSDDAAGGADLDAADDTA